MYEVLQELAELHGTYEGLRVRERACDDSRGSCQGRGGSRTKYKVEVTIYNSYGNEAETQEEAEQLARELDCYEIAYAMTTSVLIIAKR